MALPSQSPDADRGDLSLPGASFAISTDIDGEAQLRFEWVPGGLIVNGSTVW